MGAITTAGRHLVWKTQQYGSTACCGLIWINPMRLTYEVKALFALFFRAIDLKADGTIP